MQSDLKVFKGPNQPLLAPFVELFAPVGGYTVAAVGRAASYLARFLSQVYHCVLRVLLQARADEDAERQAGVSGLLAKAAAVRAEDAFKSAAAAEVFGSISGGGMGLDARINSRRHYNQR